jgi:CDP-6-deoxy-D-xylo-4-hexulose-3-dehydrase
MSQFKEDIRSFILSLQEKSGRLPKFCHNLNGAENKVYYSGAYFDENELVAAIDTLLFGKWSSSGEVCAQFEVQFSKYINQKHSFFTNSGSSANLLLIAACKEYFKWQDGDEIIVSAVGFPTTVSSIIQNGLKPIFIDIEWDTLNFDLNLISSKINSKTKAIFLSPVLGNPPNIDALNFICDKHNVKLLLDNCDSLGTKWNNKFLNEYAVASSCSFYPAHEITTLEGGMVSSNIEDIVQLARSYGTWGRDCWCVGTCNLLPNGSCGKRFSSWLTDFPDTIIDHKYVFNRIGYNLKPLDLQGAIGIEQLKKLDYICSTRLQNQKTISSLFKTYVNDLRCPNVLGDTSWVPFGVPLICSNKDQKVKLVSFLEKNGVQTRNYFAGNLLMHPGYRHLDNFLDYPESNKVLDLVFFVGCAPTISESNVNYIEKVLQAWKLQEQI